MAIGLRIARKDDSDKIRIGTQRGKLMIEITDPDDCSAHELFSRREAASIGECLLNWSRTGEDMTDQYEDVEG